MFKRSSIAAAAARAASGSMPRATAASATMSSAGTRGTVRRNWLTYLQRVPPDVQHGPRRGGGKVHQNAAVPHQDAPAVDAVVAVQAPHQGGLAGPGRPGQRQALPPPHLQPHAVQHGDHHAALQMEGEALFDGLRP